MSQMSSQGKWNQTAKGPVYLLRCFTAISAVVLVPTGGAKVWSTLGHTRILALADPVTGVSFGHLMLAVGVLELVTASVCLLGKSQTLKLGLVAWLATNFVVYRCGLWWMGWHHPCACMGNLASQLHLSDKAADNIMKVILAYLLIGSYGLLLWHWRQRQKANAES